MGFIEFTVMTTENQLIEKLNEVGDRLLQPPSSTPELLELLDVRPFTRFSVLLIRVSFAWLFQ